MEFKIYFSPNMEGIEDFQSYEINSPIQLINILPQAWDELSNLYDVDEGSSEAFITACIDGNHPMEINCASFAFYNGELSIQNTEFYEPNDPDAMNWKRVGLNVDKAYIGEAGLKEILGKIFEYQEKSK